YFGGFSKTSFAIGSAVKAFGPADIERCCRSVAARCNLAQMHDADSRLAPRRGTVSNAVLSLLPFRSCSIAFVRSRTADAQVGSEPPRDTEISGTKYRVPDWYVGQMRLPGEKIEASAIRFS